MGAAAGAAAVCAGGAAAGCAVCIIHIHSVTHTHEHFDDQLEIICIAAFGFDILQHHTLGEQTADGIQRVENEIMPP